MLNPFISVIIPCRYVDEVTKECILRCKGLSYHPFEILLLPDEITDPISGVTIISTGPISPGAKRNIGIESSNGTLCAFIDSDAFPTTDWLKTSIKYFIDSEVAAIGGPGITPNSDSFMQKAGGHVLSSFMVGSLSKRVNGSSIMESVDVPSFNFIARKEVILAVGGWNEHYWPGEDSLLCMAITTYGKKILMVPDVVVYHHRRPLFLEHIKQVSNYGVHRGFFLKKYHGNSAKFVYFIPFFFVLFSVMAFIVALVNPNFRFSFILLFSIYIAVSLGTSLYQVRDFKMVVIVVMGIFVTHVCYGLSFMTGLLSGDLKK